MARPFSHAEDEKLKAIYASSIGGVLDLNKIADEFGRSRWSIAMRASRLGLCEQGRPKSCDAISRMAESQKKRWVSKQARRDQSKFFKRWIKENGHPRGMLGKTHSKEYRKEISIRAKAMWKNKKHFLNSKQYRQHLSDRFTKLAATRTQETVFSRCKNGRRKDLGGAFFRSSWEANYARYMNHKGMTWAYEPETFWFDKIKRGCRSYKPDFKVTNSDGSVEFHEVKGWMYPRAKTALKRMKKYHPHVNIVLIDQHKYKAIAKEFSRTIPHWE